MSSRTLAEPPSAAALRELFSSRIVVLDGALGTMFQALGLAEGDFRGERLKGHPRDLRGNNDLLCLTRPDVVEGIHDAYFAAGSDMVETNTFNSTVISQADYGTEALVPEINAAAARIALRSARRAEAASPGRRCFVAGSLGPTNRTLSISPDVNRPEYRAVSWEELTAAYAQQARALLEAGVDTLLLETIFDTLNAKAALFAISGLFEERGEAVPLMISATITDASGRTLSGQTIGAFYASIAHASPLSVGINCALGGAAMRPYIEELSRIAPCAVTCVPNAGLPNAFGAYDETPAQMAAVLGEYARNGWVNLVGGCCGSTPAHIKAVAAAVRGLPPRKVPADPGLLCLSGLEPVLIP
jgi:5-methyltetrahydrofolate--homocysteine methyltransferase